MSRLQFVAGGTCGSNVSPHPDRKSRLTTSFGIVHDDTGIIIDQGFGIQNVVRYLQGVDIQQVVILQTHLHADHTDGLAQNSFLFQKKVPVRGIWAPTCGSRSMRDVWNARFAPHIWPVRPETFGLSHVLHNIGKVEPGLSLGLDIGILHLNHPGGCLGYRIRHERGDICIMTDHEPGMDNEMDGHYAQFVEGAQMLVADVQYRQSEYEGRVGISDGAATSRRGWGHASDEAFVKVLALCASPPKRIYITHHDPQRKQDDLDELVDKLDDMLTEQGMPPYSCLPLQDGYAIKY